jgi:hypothetical protein
MASWITLVPSLLYPVSIVVVALRQSGPVDSFVKSGAVSPETARRPESLKVTNRALVLDAVKSRRLLSLGDGRYYADLPGYLRRRRRTIIAFSAVGGALVLTIGLLWLLGG